MLSVFVLPDLLAGVNAPRGAVLTWVYVVSQHVVVRPVSLLTHTHWVVTIHMSSLLVAGEYCNANAA